MEAEREQRDSLAGETNRAGSNERMDVLFRRTLFFTAEPILNRLRLLETPRRLGFDESDNSEGRQILGWSSVGPICARYLS
jgi:hypothetical protein